MANLFTSRLALRVPEGQAALLDQMEAMPAAELDALSRLVFEVVRGTDRSLSLKALTRIMALRPDWVNKEDTVGFHYTPLIAAVRHGCLSMVDFLLDAGAQAHSVDARGWSALDHAARQDFNHFQCPDTPSVRLSRGSRMLAALAAQAVFDGL